MLAGIVRMRRYPLAAATKASAIPVFPDVGSIRVVTPGMIYNKQLLPYFRLRVYETAKTKSKPENGR